jgi:hypothetical protein
MHVWIYDTSLSLSLSLCMHTCMYIHSCICRMHECMHIYLSQMHTSRLIDVVRRVHVQDDLSHQHASNMATDYALEFQRCCCTQTCRSALLPGSVLAPRGHSRRLPGGALQRLGSGDRHIEIPARVLSHALDRQRTDHTKGRRARGQTGATRGERSV